MNQSGSVLLLVLLLVPLVGGLVVAVLGRGGRAERAAKLTALGFSLVELVVAIATWVGYDPAGARLQLTFSADWIPPLGVRFSLGVDGIALVMLALIAVLVPIVIGGSWAEKLPEGRTAAGFFALLLLMEAGMVGVFAATDVFLFYVFFEAVLVPMYFLIGRFGGPRRQYAAVKFFLYSLLGGLIMLASVIGVYVVGAERLGTGTFDWATLVTVVKDAPASTQIWLFLGFFVAFAIKAPLVPLHTWLPDAGAEAPVGAGVLLVGVLDKIGTFGFLRYCLPLFPVASQELAPLVLVLSVAGVLYGSLLAVAQSDLKRFVAYTSIAHFGFIALGVFAFSSQAQAGAVLYMVNHGISTGMLFLVIAMVMARGGSRTISDYGGMAKLTPVLGGLFLVAGLSSLALPGTNSFVSEFLVLIGSFPNAPVYTVLAAFGMVLAALYVLWVYQQIMQGPVRGNALVGLAGGPGAAVNPDSDTARASVSDLSRREVAVLAPLVALVLVLGFYPKPVLDVITPSVNATMSEVGLSDPVTVQEGNSR
ncbi:NADH-quinone oxidoreductase subunit M [Goodfellowiella coeruleoviolacea]|uniref:NADH dehydrogenase subunit M n=1 Tax=Goodfellowiella coeruleoviolacea TaxID=334858 RepID=A0AAE3GGX0_9PSEU|nr:NADH-quinone oxidoreductase subunit M [Goodfellowiella coeruleoviolacea]MCP2165913.1 NADH dehydrogenase subunit M (EC 1.6.5.3) [Goodfellowiella coeruleoviolacea]